MDVDAGKYLTGQPATWGQGDWNGAPGGSPSDPPAGNGLFDQTDIIAALAGGHYMTGPYASALGATDAIAVSSVPEPSGAVLAALGLAGLVLLAWRVTMGQLATGAQP